MKITKRHKRSSFCAFCGSTLCLSCTFPSLLWLRRRIRLIAQADGMRIAAGAGAARDFVVAIRENAGAAWKAGVDQPHHRDHLARDFLLGILVGGEIALHVTMRALHTKSLVEALHDEPDFGFRIQQFQILRRWQWSRP